MNTNAPPIPRRSTGWSIALASTIVALLSIALMSVAATTASANPTATHRPATATTQCYLYESDCYHVLAGKTFGTQQSCRTYGMRYTNTWGGLRWIKCISRPPSGHVYLYVFFFTCPKTQSVQWCKLHKYP